MVILPPQDQSGISQRTQKFYWCRKARVAAFHVFKTRSLCNGTLWLYRSRFAERSHKNNNKKTIKIITPCIVSLGLLRMDPTKNKEEKNWDGTALRLMGWWVDPDSTQYHKNMNNASVVNEKWKILPNLNLFPQKYFNKVINFIRPWLGPNHWLVARRGTPCP